MCSLDELVNIWLPIRMDAFSALADPVRRSLLEQLAGEGTCRVVDLTAGRAISRPAVSRHLRLLGEAGLVSVQDVGRERHYRVELGPLEQVEGFALSLRAGVASLSAPVTAHDLDALDLEVRRTVRERRDGEPRHTRTATGTTNSDTDTTEETA